MALIRPETFGITASGHLPITYTGYMSPVACFPGQTGVTISYSGTKQWLVPFWNNGGVITSGAPTQCSASNAYTGHSLTALDNNRMLYTTCPNNVNHLNLQVFRINPDATFSSGTVVLFGGLQSNGYHGGHMRTEAFVLRTSGEITKCIIGGHDFWRSTTAPNPTIHVVTVSGMTVSCGPRTGVFVNASGFNQLTEFEAFRIDDYHIGVRNVGDDRFRFLRINDDDSIAFLGTEHCNFTLPSRSTGVEIARLSPVSGMMLVARDFNGSATRLRVRPFRFENGEVVFTSGVGAQTYLDNELQIPGNFNYGTNSLNHSMAPVDDCTVAIAMSHNDANGFVGYARYNGTRVTMACSGFITPLPMSGADDRLYNMSMTTMPGSGVLVTYKRGGDNYGVCSFTRPSGSSTTAETGPIAVFNSGDTRAPYLEPIDNTHAVLVYQDCTTASPYYYRARIVTVNPANLSLTFSDPVTFGSGVNMIADNVEKIAVARLDATHFILGYPRYDSGRGAFARLMQIEGSTISFPDTPFNLGSGNTDQAIHQVRAMNIRPNTALIYGEKRDASNGPGASILRLAILETGQLRYTHMETSGYRMVAPGPYVAHSEYAPHVSHCAQFDDETFLFGLNNSRWTNDNYCGAAFVRPLRIVGEVIIPSGDWKHVGDFIYHNYPNGMLALTPNKLVLAMPGTDCAHYDLKNGAVRVIDADAENDVFDPGDPFSGAHSGVWHINANQNLFSVMQTSLRLSDHTFMLCYKRNVPDARGIIQILGRTGYGSETVGTPRLLTANSPNNAYQPRLSRASDGAVAAVIPETNPAANYWIGFLSQTEPALYIESGTAPLRITGVSGSTLIDIYFEPFFMTSDAVPQIVGDVGTLPPGTAAIQLWHLGRDGISGVTGFASGCYAIGDTGHWGWSTDNLPVGLQDTRRQFHYRIVGSDGQHCQGQFVLRPQGHRASVPSAGADYLKQLS